jgi:hypothetical protein
MKYLSLLLSILMFLFVFVQFNDPDFYYWASIYSIPALSSLLVFLNPKIIHKLPLQLLFIILFIVIIFLTGFYWPKESLWWEIDIWWNTETAREGMGMMISSLVMIISGLTFKLKNK